MLLLIRFWMWIHDHFSTSLNIMSYSILRYMFTHQRAPSHFSVTLSPPLGHNLIIIIIYYYNYYYQYYYY